MRQDEMKLSLLSETKTKSEYEVETLHHTLENLMQPPRQDNLGKYFFGILSAFQVTIQEAEFKSN
jgi:hypothetical protein